MARYIIRKVWRILFAALKTIFILVLLLLTYACVSIYYGEEKLPNGYTAKGIMFANYMPYRNGYVAILDVHRDVVVPGPVESFDWDGDAVYGEYEKGTAEPYFFYSRKEKVLQRFDDTGELNAYLQAWGLKEYKWGSAYNISKLHHEKMKEIYRTVKQKGKYP